MLKFDEATIKNELISSLEKSELEVGMLGLAVSQNSNPIAMLSSILGIERPDNEDKSVDEKILLIHFFRSSDLIMKDKPTLLQALVFENGDIKLVETECEKGTHYHSITKLQNIKELPLLLEDPNLFERCDCND